MQIFELGQQCKVADGVDFIVGEKYFLEGYTVLKLYKIITSSML